MKIKSKRTVLANYGLAMAFILAAVTMFFRGYLEGENSSLIRYIFFMGALFALMVGFSIAALSIHIASLWRNIYWLTSVSRNKQTQQTNSEERLQNIGR